MARHPQKFSFSINSVSSTEKYARKWLISLKYPFSEYHFYEDSANNGAIRKLPSAYSLSSTGQNIHRIVIERISPNNYINSYM